MTGKPLGPFETEALARAAAVAATEPGLLPVKPAENHRLLRRVCQAAGVAMGRYDERIVEWLSIWEPTTVVVVAGWIGRAYEAGLTPDARRRRDVVPGRGGHRPPGASRRRRLAVDARRGFPAGCGDCAVLDPKRRPDHARDEVTAAAYAALRARLGGDRS